METKKYRVLITGNRGFVGTETQNLFIERGCDVVGFDLMDGFDIRDGLQLGKIIEETRPNRILHLAAIARFAEADRDQVLAFETNALGTANVVAVAKKYHIPLVYASTGSVYMPIKDEPPITEEFPAIGNSPYGCSKSIGEKYVMKHCPHIILRYAHLYGAEKRYHGLIGGFLSRIEFGMAPVLYGGKQSNDFTYIKDVAEANYLAVIAPWDKWNQAYNIGTGERLTAEEAGKIVCDVFGYKGKVEKKEGRIVDPLEFVYDMSKAEKMLGFKAKFSFEKGLVDMKESFKENFNEPLPKHIR